MIKRRRGKRASFMNTFWQGVRRERRGWAGAAKRLRRLRRKHAAIVVAAFRGKVRVRMVGAS